MRQSPRLRRRPRIGRLIVCVAFCLAAAPFGRAHARTTSQRAPAPGTRALTEALRRYNADEEALRARGTIALPELVAHWRALGDIRARLTRALPGASEADWSALRHEVARLLGEASLAEAAAPTLALALDEAAVRERADRRAIAAWARRRLDIAPAATLATAAIDVDAPAFATILATAVGRAEAHAADRALSLRARAAR